MVNCEQCGLNKTCLRPNIPPVGDTTTAEILFIGEAPGKEEDEQGIPFIGDSGKILREAIDRYNIQNFVITNTCRCRPPNNRTPKGKEIEICFPQTIDLINTMPNLKLIVPIGNVALRALTGQQGITKVAGTEMVYEDKKMMPLIHPATFLYAKKRNNIKTFFEHVSRIPSILRGELSTDDYGEYVLINTINAWSKYYNKLKNAKWFVYDLETIGLNPFFEESSIRQIQFSMEDRKAFALTLLGWNAVEYSTILRNLKEIFEDETIGKVGHNIKFDNLYMRTILDIDVKGIIGDTSLSQYTLHPSKSTGLKELAYTYSKLGGYEQAIMAMSDEKIEALVSIAD